MVVFRQKQLWIEGEEGVYFFCLEEMVVWHKSYKLDGTVLTLQPCLQGCSVKFSL